MSWNITAIIPDNEGGTFPLYLARANAGFTGTARISVGDILKFDYIYLIVESIEHAHQVPHGKIAPTTEVICGVTNRVFTSEDIEVLKAHGFNH